MNTTVILLEFLLSGLQAALWLALLLLTIFGTSWIRLENIKGFETVLTLALLSVVYPLGVFVDNLADHFLKGWARRIRAKHISDESYSVFRLLVLKRDDWLANYFDYMRMRTRICRSSALNLLLISVILQTFIFVRLVPFPGTSKIAIALVSFVVAACLSALALGSWREVTSNFHQRVAQGFSLPAGNKAEN